MKKVVEYLQKLFRGRKVAVGGALAALALFMFTPVLGLAADLTTTAGVIMGLDFRHPTVQTIAIALVALGGLTVAGLFAGRPLEGFLEHAIMDWVSIPWVKTIVPGVIAFFGFYLLTLAAGVPWQAAFLPALIAWSKSMNIHASDTRTISAKAEGEG